MAIDTLGANALASNSVTTAKIANDAVTGAKIPADAVVAADIADGSITTAKLADNAVTGAKIGQHEVKTDNIENSTSLHLDCTFTNADATVTTASTSSLAVGMEMHHSHGSTTTDADHNGNIIRAGSRISSITNSTTFEMTIAAAGGGTDVLTHFTSGVTKSKIANSSVSLIKKADNDQAIEPLWTRLVYNAGANYTHQLLSEQGTKISYANGNNGPSGIARLKGTTGHGDFILMFTPGYSWGYSGIYMADVAGFIDLDNPVWMYGSGQNAGYDAWSFLNNSSNNIAHIYHWDGSANNLDHNMGTGLNGNTWRVWRVNGVLYAKAGGYSNVTLQASNSRQDFVIWNQAQSPGSCEIIQASRMPAGGA